MRTFSLCRLIQRHILNHLRSVTLLMALVLISFTTYSQCTVYNVSSTGSTTICTGATGPTVTLDNSVTGVNYQLKRGTTNVGSAKAGNTGTTLSWINNNTAGTYTVTASKSTAPTCSATMNGSVVVTVNALPTAPTAIGASRCGDGTLSLTASSTVSGIFNWYAASTGGSPLQTNSTSATSNTFVTPSLSATTVYYVTFSNGTCESSPRKSVTATVNTIPTITSVTGGTTCGTGTVPIQVNGSAAGTFKLYAALTGGSALSTSPASLTSHTFTSPSITVTKTYYVTETVSGCESTPRTSVVATVAPPQSFTVSGGGAITSQSTSVTINLSGSQPSVNYQLKLNGTNSGSAVAGNSAPLSWTVSTPGTYSVVAQLGTCNTAMGSVTVTNGYVDDALEYAALKDLFLSTNNGTGWINKTNWPTSWPATATSAEFGTWFGVGVSEGDVTSLMLYRNKLNGTLPTSIGNLKSLQSINMETNQLSGTFPSSLSNAHNLTYLMVQDNQFTGPLPVWSGTDFPFLQILYFSYNQFSGGIPPSYATFPSMSQLFLNTNQLTGIIPSEFATMTWLQDFRTAGNPFTSGPIPEWIGQMSGLTTLLMGGNNFTGTIPSSLSSLHNLAYLGLDGNQLTGGLQGLQGCTSMATLALSYNQLNDLSADLSGMPHLSYLQLNNNQFDGPLPEWFGGLTSLAVLYLNSNQFSLLPSSFRNLEHLTNLYLQDNQFKGNLPDVSLMTNLKIVNVSRNQFTGSLPASFSIPNIEFFDASLNQLSGPFPSISNWTKITSLAITGNQFNGAFPSATGLNKLTSVEASYNQFTSIPVSLLGIPMIAYLNFRGNRLSAIDGLETEVAANQVQPPSSLGTSYIDFNQLDFKTIGTLNTLGFPFVSFPQNEINDVKLVGFNVNGSLNIPSRPVQTTTTVTWEKNIGGTWTDVTSSSEDGTHKNFQRSSAPPTDAGTYRWKMTDTQFPNSVILSAGIEVKTNIQITVDNYAFQYNYDERQRMTHKKVAGADWVYMVYDNRDRLVMTQDGNQRLTNQWSYTKYDVLNRPIITGLYTHSTAIDQTGMSALISTTSFYETFDASLAATYGYTNTVFTAPNFIPANFEVLVATYYDTYDFKNLSTLSNTLNDYAIGQLSTQTSLTGTYAQEPQSNTRVIGQVTGGLVKVKQQNNYLLSVNYYDEKYRPIQIVSDNVLGGKDRTTNIYDFSGKVLASRTSHNLPATNKYIIRTFTYDHVGRLLTTSHSIDGASFVLLAKNEYNELGQLIDKNLHSTDNGNIFKQSTDYRYNIRGWLTSINNADLTQSSNNTDNSGYGKDLFGMELAYEKPVTDLTTTSDAQYNGNVSAITYSNNQALGTIKSNGYKYAYDPLNRLLKAEFRQKIGTWGLSPYLDAGNQPQTAQAFSETGFAYDLNGNINKLKRSGAAGSSQLDDLQYTYTGNQLLSVSDAGDISKGFIDGNTTGNDYNYDANGNIITDKNKAITTINYNHLNLPEKVIKATGDYINYIYDATGRKLSQQVYNAGNTLKKRTDYAGEYFYENDTLKFINQEEGRIVMVKEGQPITPEYQYHLKDHLGNVRMTFTTIDETESPTATLETANVITEQNKFLRYINARTVQSPLFDHTNGTATGYAERLNGSTNEKYGIARSISVMPGDKINAEVYAKYIDTNSSNWTAALNTLVSQIANGTATAGTVIDGVGYSSSTSSFPLAGGLIDKSGGSATGPKAYLNWLVFDRNFVLLNGGFKKMSDAAKEYGQDVAHEYLASPDINITQPGYVYIYLSNEESSIVEVYFDDMKVTQVKSPVIQQDEYYPFGLTFNGYQRENSPHNNYLYNSKELQDELNLGWMDYGARMYMSEIGRWGVIDPLADLRLWVSPYNYTQNNPISRFDPSGMLDDYAMDKETGVITLIKETQDKTDKLVDKDNGKVIASKVDKGLLKDGMNIEQNGLETSNVQGGTKLAVKISIYTEKEIQGTVYKNSEGKSYLKVDPYNQAEKTIDKETGDPRMTPGRTNIIQKSFTSSDGTFTGNASYAWHTHPGWTGFPQFGFPKPSIEDELGVMYNKNRNQLIIPFLIYARYPMSDGKITSNVALYKFNTGFMGGVSQRLLPQASYGVEPEH